MKIYQHMVKEILLNNKVGSDFFGIIPNRAVSGSCKTEISSIFLESLLFPSASFLIPLSTEIEQEKKTLLKL